MGKLVVSIGSRLRAWPVVVLIVFLSWAGICAIAFKLNWADYLSSVAGYDRLPYNDVDPNLGFWVGALPQLIQVAFGVWAIEKNHRLAAVITIIAFVIDIYTDVVFKTYGLNLNPMEYGFATLLTFFMFSVGSEFLLVASLQNMREYGPLAWNAAGQIFGGLISRIIGLFSKGAKGSANVAQASAAWVLGDAAPDSMKPERSQPRRQSGYDPMAGFANAALGGGDEDDDEMARAIALAQTQLPRDSHNGMSRAEAARQRFGKRGGNSVNGA